MIADTIEKVDRGDDLTHEDSYFELEFSDGSKVDERAVNWSSVAEQRTVYMSERPKTVMVCTLEVKTIRVVHKGLETLIEVPRGLQVYQACKSQAIYVDGRAETSMIGRTVGLVDGDKIVEERYLDGIAGQVVGVRI